MLLRRVRVAEVVEVARLPRRLGRREELLRGLSTADSATVKPGRSVEARGVERVDVVCMLFFRRGGK
jgi:hypothetical protein